MNETSRPTAFTQWAESVRQLYDMLPRLTYVVEEMATVPASSSPRERLEELVQLWQAIGIDSPAVVTSPGKAFGDRVKLWLENAAAVVADVASRLVYGVEEGIGSALAAGGTHLDLIATSDFGAENLLVTTAADGWQTALGLVRGLPTQHYLRAALPDDAALYQTVNGPAVVLGTVFQGTNGLTPRTFYFTQDVIRQTAAWRQRQRHQEAADRDAQARRQAEIEERRRHASAERDAERWRRLTAVEAA
jgi:hypothetical protein